jgi:hypothetical protein
MFPTPISPASEKSSTPSSPPRGNFDALLDQDVVLRAYSGAVRVGASTSRAIRSAPDAAKRVAKGRAARPALVNGTVGVVVAPRGRVLMVLGFTIRGQKIVEIDAIADPAPSPARSGDPRRLKLGTLRQPVMTAQGPVREVVHRPSLVGPNAPVIKARFLRLGLDACQPWHHVPRMSRAIVSLVRSQTRYLSRSRSLLAAFHRPEHAGHLCATILYRHQVPWRGLYLWSARAAPPISILHSLLHST